MQIISLEYLCGDVIIICHQTQTVNQPSRRYDKTNPTQPTHHCDAQYCRPHSKWRRRIRIIKMITYVILPYV